VFLIDVNLTIVIRILLKQSQKTRLLTKMLNHIYAWFLFFGCFYKSIHLNFTRGLFYWSHISCFKPATFLYMSRTRPRYVFMMMMIIQ